MRASCFAVAIVIVATVRSGGQDQPVVAFDERNVAALLTGMERAVAGDYTSAQETLRTAADGGNAHARALLGVFLEYGPSNGSDPDSTMSWYAAAAAAGDATAMTRLGLFRLASGVAGGPDSATGLRLLLKAAAADDDVAQLVAAYCLEHGIGSPRDFDAAVRWYTRSAQAGNGLAQFNLGTLYEEGAGVAQSAVVAAQWYTRAENQGVPEAAFALGRLYETGRGVPRNARRALSLYLKAALRGLAPAQNNLGVLYERGTGTTRDLGLAQQWYLAAAIQGDTTAQHNLARLYERRTPKLSGLVYKWYAIASRSSFLAEADRQRTALELSDAQLQAARALVNEWRPTDWYSPDFVRQLGIEQEPQSSTPSRVARGPRDTPSASPTAGSPNASAPAAAPPNARYCNLTDPPPPGCPGYMPTTRDLVDVPAPAPPLVCQVSDPPPAWCPNHVPDLAALLRAARTPSGARASQACLYLDPPPAGCPGHDRYAQLLRPPSLTAAPRMCFVADPPPPSCEMGSGASASRQGVVVSGGDRLPPAYQYPPNSMPQRVNGTDAADAAAKFAIQQAVKYVLKTAGRVLNILVAGKYGDAPSRLEYLEYRKRMDALERKLEERDADRREVMRERREIMLNQYLTANRGATSDQAASAAAAQSVEQQKRAAEDRARAEEQTRKIQEEQRRVAEERQRDLERRDFSRRMQELKPSRPYDASPQSLEKIGRIA